MSAVDAENKVEDADDGFKTVPPRRKKVDTKEKEKEQTPAEKEADRRRKFKTAATIIHQVLSNLVKAAVEGASIAQLCLDGDAEITKLTAGIYNHSKRGPVPKGVAFPTSISVNNVVSHFSPLPTDELHGQTLANGDVVKIQLGAHIDGYAAVQTETLIVGASKENPATGKKADVVKAAYTAAQVALRQMKVDEKNFTITETISKVTSQWDCKPVEGMLSCEHVQGSIDGKKRIILNPTHEQRSGHEKASFAEGEVYGVDVLVTSQPDGKVKTSETRTSIYQRISGVNYQLKLKTSKGLIEAVESKHGFFPFNIRSLEDEKKARVGIQEGERHGVFRPYEVTQSPKDTYVAAFMFTVLITAEGPSLLTEPSVWYSEDKLKTEKQLEDEEFKTLLSQPVTSVKGDGEVKVSEKSGSSRRIRHPKNSDAPPKDAAATKTADLAAAKKDVAATAKPTKGAPTKNTK